MNDATERPVGASVPSKNLPGAVKRSVKSFPVILSDQAINVWVVLLAWILPQSVLVWVNWQAWDLAQGDMSETQRMYALQIFGGEMLALGTGIVVAGYLGFRRAGLLRWMGVIPLAVCLIYLATVLNLASRAIPSELTDWMLPPDQWMFKQFALVMPAALLGAFRLMCPRLLDTRQPDESTGMLWALGLIAASIGYMPIMGMASAGFHGPDGEVFEIFLISGFLLLSLLAAASVLRVSVSLYVWARSETINGLGALTFLVALLAPLAGLFLNAGLPFPFDFQYAPIYALAIVNGLVLLLPNYADPLRHRLVWLAQCALFPFTLYFFLVFVPFLPLAPIGMFFILLGGLIYVPTMLFALHGYRLWDGYRREALHGSKWAMAALGLGAIAAWPVGYTLQARWDKASLNEALDYLQYPNYSTNERFAGNRGALKSALVHLRDFKQGFYLPLISEYYNWLAFDNLVLPQPKLDELYETYFGEPMPASTLRNNPDFLMTGGSRRTRTNMTEALSTPQGLRPNATAQLERVESSAQVAQGAVRVKATLTLTTAAAEAAEYLGTVQVPPGVVISGFWLTIGTERVPGKIFEKRAAMWVYQKITEHRPVPRDPALLRYTGPGRLELSVYPVTVREPRTVEVEFLYPQGMTPEILVGQNPVTVPHPAPPEASVTVAENGNFTAAVPAPIATTLPSYTRTPYLHVIVDASMTSPYRDPAKLDAALTAVAAQFPQITQARVTFANYESEDFRDGIMFPVAELARVRPRAEAFRGGFLAERAVRSILWQHHLQLSKPEADALRQFPQIVVLSGPRFSLPTDRGNLAEFARFLPDQPGFWLVREGAGTKQYVPLDPTQTEPGIQPVRVFQVADQRFIAPASTGAVHTSLHPPPQRPTGIQRFDAATGQFLALEQKVVVEAGDFAKAIAPWTLELGRMFEPYRRADGSLGQLLEVCRATGVLVPSAAYMVVENKAQWKILEKTEEKTLKGHEALQLEETTPEPATIALLVVGLAAILLWSRGRPIFSAWLAHFALRR